jgi:tripartite-type tricarboxylate transporter receptor subunit TctC
MCGTRSAIAPDVPTLDEAGLAGFEAYSWYGIWAPAASSPAIVARLQEIVVPALQQPAVRAPLIADGFDIIGSSPAAFATHIDQETARYTKLVEDAGLTFE